MTKNSKIQEKKSKKNLRSERTNWNKKLIPLCLALACMALLVTLMQSALAYSDKTNACLNCHAMVEPYQQLQLSKHKPLQCNECHAPTAFVPKMELKVKSGLRDLYITALGETPNVLELTSEGRNVVQENCIKCHYGTISTAHIQQSTYCTDCHREAAHK